METTFIRTLPNLMVLTKITTKQDNVQSAIQMEIDMKVIQSRVNEMEKESTITQMVSFMLESGKIISAMELDN